jgi:hypothetical protein
MNIEHRTSNVECRMENMKNQTCNLEETLLEYYEYQNG